MEWITDPSSLPDHSGGLKLPVNVCLWIFLTEQQQLASSQHAENMGKYFGKVSLHGICEHAYQAGCDLWVGTPALEAQASQSSAALH